MSGFIYIWRDRKSGKYYVGSHWGKEDDGYVCSSVWMNNAYRDRPGDFKRRILERFEDRSKTHEIEHRWLQMMKIEELGKRYYNLANYRFGHWSETDEVRLTTAEKISRSKTGQPRSQETKDKISQTRKLRKCPGFAKGYTPWNKGRKYSISINTLKDPEDSK